MLSCFINELVQMHKILEFNQYHKSDKTLSVICTDLKPLVEKIDGCKNNFCKIICNKSK